MTDYHTREKRTNKPYETPPTRTGANQHGAKLSEAKIHRIKALLEAGQKQNAIAEIVGCSQGMVSHVKHGRRG
jgi:hypothetical protein